LKNQLIRYIRFSNRLISFSVFLAVDAWLLTESFTGDLFSVTGSDFNSSPPATTAADSAARFPSDSSIVF
jgi:hypothetical protein